MYIDTNIVHRVIYIHIYNIYSAIRISWGGGGEPATALKKHKHKKLGRRGAEKENSGKWQKSLVRYDASFAFIVGAIWRRRNCKCFMNIYASHPPIHLCICLSAYLSLNVLPLVLLICLFCWIWLNLRGPYPQGELQIRNEHKQYKSLAWIHRHS